LEDVVELVTKYLDEKFKELGTKCEMEIDILGDGKPWVADKDHWNYVAAQKATKVSDSFPCPGIVWT
jgi:Cys-Gly metallodipeptidase DUG1